MEGTETVVLAKSKAMADIIISETLDSSSAYEKSK